MALTQAGKVFVVCVAVFGVAAYWLASRIVRRQTGGARGRGETQHAFHHILL